MPSSLEFVFPDDFLNFCIYLLIYFRQRNDELDKHDENLF